MPAGGAAPPGTGRVRRPSSDSPHRAAHHSPSAQPTQPPPSPGSLCLGPVHPFPPWRQSTQRGGRGGRGGEAGGACCRRRQSRVGRGDARAAASGQQHQQTPPPAAPPPAPPATPILMPDDPRGAPAPPSPSHSCPPPTCRWTAPSKAAGGFDGRRGSGQRGTTPAPASKHSCKQTGGDRKTREGSRQTPERGRDRQITAVGDGKRRRREEMRKRRKMRKRRG